MNKLERKQINEEIDVALMELDAVLSGRSNMIAKTDLYILRNILVELQNKYG